MVRTAASRTGSPWSAAAVLLLGLLYGASPIDLIPDIVPLLGWSDDAGVILTALFIAWRLWRRRRAAVSIRNR